MNARSTVLVRTRKRCSVLITTLVLSFFALGFSAREAAAQKARLSTDVLGDCLIHDREKEALEFVIEKIPVDQYLRKFEVFKDQMHTCLTAQNIPQVTFSPRSADFLLATALVRRLYGDHDPGDLSHAQAGLATDGISMYRLDVSGSDKAMRKNLQIYRVNLDDENDRFFAECVVRSASAHVRDALIAKPSSVEQERAYSAISKDFAVCLPGHGSSSISAYDAVGWLALTYLKLAKSVESSAAK